MKEYKTFDELKEEIGDKFEEYMYQANIELMEIIKKLKEHLQEPQQSKLREFYYKEILNVISEIENENN